MGEESTHGDLKYSQILYQDLVISLLVEILKYLWGASSENQCICMYMYAYAYAYAYVYVYVISLCVCAFVSLCCVCLSLGPLMLNRMGSRTTEMCNDFTLW